MVGEEAPSCTSELDVGVADIGNWLRNGVYGRSWMETCRLPEGVAIAELTRAMMGFNEKSCALPQLKREK